jgi:P-type E1-E2 ATPase
VINAAIGFIQEGKAEAALEAMRKMVSPRASVLRDGGARTTVAVAELVPGDIVLLEAGDRVPADLRLLRARGLLVDEALLTGESVAAEKLEAPAAADAALGDRRAWRTPARSWPRGRRAAWSWRRASRPRSGASARCCRAWSR